MTWELAASYWLLHVGLGSGLFLAAGGAAVLCCRRPVRQVRLIELTLLGCLLLPVVSLLPGLPRLALGWVGPAQPEAIPAASERVSHALVPGDMAMSVTEGVAIAPVAAAAPVVAAPAVVRAAPRPAWLTWPRGLVLAYAGVTLLLLARFLGGVLRLQWLAWGAAPAGADVHELFRRVAGAEGRKVRLLVSPRVDTPLAFGWRRPVILLPAELCAADPGTLRFCLAHEWSHVERRDLRTWHLAALAQLLFFYQPLLWWLRRQLRLCQDFLADARAAEEAATAADYAEYLVGLARRRLQEPCVAALGIGDRRSHLYRRVVMLLQHRQPLERRCRRLWNATATLAAFALLVGIATVRLDASPQASRGREAPEEPKKDSTPPSAGEPLHYTGRVVKKGTDTPLAGATVTIRRTLYGDPRHQGEKIVQETKHQTDAAGKYSFTIPPEQSIERYLYIEVEAEHPDCAPLSPAGYALSMIRKNEQLGGRPFFEKLELRPGQAISGKIETPDGKPAAGVKLLAYSVSDEAKPNAFEYGSFAHAQTGADGRFRIMLTTPGRAVFWILPEQYALSRHAVKNNQRGDLGIFGVQEGVRLRGKALDAQGQPVKNVWVNASLRRGAGDDDLNGLQVADAIGRAALTNDQGEFALGPLPPGEYDVKPDKYSHDNVQRDRRQFPLPAVFLAQRVALRAGEEPPPLEVRATPHVTVEAQYLDSKGKPTRGHEMHIFGQIDNGHWFGEGKPDAQGKIVARVPHGLHNAQLTLMTNEHGVLRYRKAPGTPLQNQNRIDLGALNDDVKGIEIIRYTAPILLIDARGEDGNQVKDFKVQVLYGAGRSNKQQGVTFINGVKGDVHLEKQEDGRWRSSQLLPDEELTVTVSADGYEPRTEKLTLPEGEKKELSVRLDKKPAPAAK